MVGNKKSYVYCLISKNLKKMKNLKYLLIVAFIAVGFSANAQWLDYGSFSNTTDRIGIGQTADSSSYSLAVTGNSVYNGQLHINGKIKAKSTDGLFVFGFGGNMGANAEFYSSYHSTRPGQLRFVYGGSGFGDTRFMHYDGSTWTTNMIVNYDGNVGIGTETPSSKLEVAGEIACTNVVSSGALSCTNISANGKITTKEVEVTLDAFPDYVFDEEYHLSPLSDVEKFIKENKHLPGIPPANEVIANGLSLGEMNVKLMEKVEELTLYIIQMQKEIDELKSNE